MRLFVGRAKSKHPNGYLFSLFFSGKDVKVFALHSYHILSFCFFKLPQQFQGKHLHAKHKDKL